jgi:putative DNA primase/helicase
MRKAREMSKLFLLETVDINDDDKRKKAGGFALKAGDAQKLKAMIELAGSQAGIAATPQVFDSDPYLLGVLNGVVDLRSGKFRPGRQDDFLTKRAGTEFVEGATCPIWEAFLRDIFAGDEALLTFFQNAIGYSLSGLTSEQVLFFLHGSGQNGKSTSTETVLALMGDYGQKAPAKLFVTGQNGNEPEKEIARLVGVRFVVGSEIEEGSRFAESRVKDLTGQDTLTGRFIYGSPFDFKPTHKLFIYGNHKPDIRGTDKGIWRRMLLMPFLVEIEASKKDRQLPSKLLAELPGILLWAIEGFLRWQRDGLQVPASVRQATNEYQGEEDELGEFIAERCALGPDEKVRKDCLLQDYLSWAAMRGTRVPLKAKAFTKNIRSRTGVTEGKSGVTLWLGISLKPDPLEAPEPTTVNTVPVDTKAGAGDPPVGRRAANTPISPNPPCNNNIKEFREKERFAALLPKTAVPPSSLVSNAHPVHGDAAWCYDHDGNLIWVV